MALGKVKLSTKSFSFINSNKIPNFKRYNNVNSVHGKYNMNNSLIIIIYFNYNLLSVYHLVNDLFSKHFYTRPGQIHFVEIAFSYHFDYKKISYQCCHKWK